MKSFERRKKILEILNKNEKVKIKYIAKILEEKEDNIRRDIRILGELDLLTKIHGGISLKKEDSMIEKFYFNKIFDRSEKEKIAKKAIEYINEGDSIYLGSGTTVYIFAELLKEQSFNLNIITNSLPVATLLAKKNNYTLIFVGGELKRENYYFMGTLVEDFIKYFTINKAFVGARGFDLNHGFTISTLEEAAILKSIASSSEEVIVLVNKIKFEKTSFIKMSTFYNELNKKVTKVITNNTPKIEYIRKLESDVTEVVLV